MIEPGSVSSSVRRFRAKRAKAKEIGDQVRIERFNNGGWRDGETGCG